MLYLELHKLLKNYKGFVICFDESEQFSHTITEGGRVHTTLARNVIIFGADMSFRKHANNKANNIYVMGKVYVQKINGTTIYAEKMFYRNFTYLVKNVCLVCIIMEMIVICLLMVGKN